MLVDYKVIDSFWLSKHCKLLCKLITIIVPVCNSASGNYNWSIHCLMNASIIRNPLALNVPQSIWFFLGGKYLIWLSLGIVSLYVFIKTLSVVKLWLTKPRFSVQISFAYSLAITGLRHFSLSGMEAMLRSMNYLQRPGKKEPQRKAGAPKTQVCVALFPPLRFFPHERKWTTWSALCQFFVNRSA